MLNATGVVKQNQQLSANILKNKGNIYFYSKVFIREWSMCYVQYDILDRNYLTIIPVQDTPELHMSMQSSEINSQALTNARCWRNLFTMLVRRGSVEIQASLDSHTRPYTD
jgi:hypothetical protein